MVDDREDGSVEAAIAHRSQAPELEWLEAIYRSHAADVMRSAYRITGSAEDAEDVVQTVFIRLARAARRPDLSAGALPYLRRAAINAALDVLRARKIRAATDLDSASPLASDDPAGEPERVQHNRQLKDHLRQALAELNERNARMFVLRYFEDLDNRQIAALFQTSPATVAVTLHRVRCRLADAMRPFLGGLQ